MQANGSYQSEDAREERVRGAGLRGDPDEFNGYLWSNLSLDSIQTEESIQTICTPSHLLLKLLSIQLAYKSAKVYSKKVAGIKLNQGKVFFGCLESRAHKLSSYQSFSQKTIAQLRFKRIEL